MVISKPSHPAIYLTIMSDFSFKRDTAFFLKFFFQEIEHQ
jgi:hypothetical protein